MTKKLVYFDNAATTQIHPKVVEKMLPYLSGNFGNPSSIHSFGRKTRVAIEEAREVISDFLNADAGEIYFTSGGTEANNFSVFGIAKTDFFDSGKKKIVASKSEHHCVLDAYEELGKSGFDLNLLNVNSENIVDPEILENLIDDKTSLVSIMQVNNETGAVNDIKELTKIAHSKNSYFHTDAVQSFSKIKIDVKDLNVDSLAVSSHKINGPKGIGALYAKSGTPLQPLIFGGSQERNRRGGTENVAAIIGFAEAVKIANKNLEENFKIVSEIKDHFKNGISNIDSTGIKLNSADSNFPYILSLTFLSDFYKNDAESILMYLDINGIAASNGAACSSGTLKPSHVILSMGRNSDDAQGTIRFSFGAQNTIEEVDYALEVLEKMSRKFKK